MILAQDMYWLVSERHMIMPSGNLQIHDVRPSDDGSYKCIAINRVNSQTRAAPNSVYLNVRSELRSNPYA